MNPVVGVINTQEGAIPVGAVLLSNQKLEIKKGIGLFAAHFVSSAITKTDGGESVEFVSACLRAKRKSLQAQEEGISSPP